MSLVNDMLKDLEAGRREEVPAELFSPVPDERGSTRNYYGLSSALVAVALAAFYGGFQWQGGDEALPAPTLATQAIALPASAEAAQDESIAAELALVTEAHAATVDASAPIDSKNTDSEKIAALLRAAERALGEDRLTSPIADNAFTRYQAVLLIEPGNEGALTGIRRIAGRYLTFYEQKIGAGDARAAQLYRLKAEQVVVGWPELQGDLQAQLAAIEAAAIERALASAPSANQQENRAQAQAGAQVSDAVQPQRVRLVESNRALNEQALRQARKLRARGQDLPAVALLQARLEVDGEAVAIGRELMDIYIERADLAAARSLLPDLAGLSPSEVRQLQARIAAKDGDTSGAIALMEGATPPLTQATSYYAYLAALYHQDGRYQDAASLYERLLTNDGTAANYWLGLAVSLDALQDRSGALKAFQFVRRYSAPDAASRRYVEERIRSLSG